ncbi:MAG TPA: lysophospholipid acyltransferase family protein [Actinomycetota bacterium]|nr:lysophospholipid acyltransferase family protein [Actinomycetota bacterium]
MGRRGDLDGWWWFGLTVVGILTRVFFRPRFVGVACIPAAGPSIVAGNHVSSLDGIVLGLATGERARRMTRFLAAAEFFAKPWFGWALRRYRQIPLRRGEGDRGALDEAVATIRSGALAGIFPEGRVNPDPEGGLQPGRTGVARLALATGAPVVPVGIWGTQVRWPRGRIRFRRPLRPVLVLAYGEPIVPQGDPTSLEDLQLFTGLVMAGIEKQVVEARAIARMTR